MKAQWFTTTPHAVAAEVQRIVGQMAEIDCIAWGGYAAAERCRIIFGREEVLLEAKADPSSLSEVQAVQVRCTLSNALVNTMAAYALIQRIQRNKGLRHGMTTK